ncbi:PREDICTED: slit homolog 2 protein-like [Branchiostoma belcheri]|uniref:Slit homolog 2 protein-like n=1 Tax=Branchiostoma belcheri TaxID=7741 RepID=A0A6P4Y7T7_BRABE|nr:PREDICTED: slit homolog 2 protein-like [Branchiostoma belcheri]
MSNKARRMLVLLLIILKEAGPTAACSSSCSSVCDCSNRGLTSVPQDLPTYISWLDLEGNAITDISQSDFSRYRSLKTLDLPSNQISIIQNKTFHYLTSLTLLYLENNHLTRLPADIFEGLGNLESLWLDNNNISTITADTFGNLLELQTLKLSGNNISTFPVEALSNLNTSVLSDLRLDSNKLETLTSMAYDILASISTVNISNNPWQCDCRMAPFKQRMNGSYPFEDQTRCAGPANLTGHLLRDVNPEDLICKETTPVSVYSTSSTKHMVDSTLTLSLSDSSSSPFHQSVMPTSKAPTLSPTLSNTPTADSNPGRSTGSNDSPFVTSKASTLEILASSPTPHTAHTTESNPGWSTVSTDSPFGFQSTLTEGNTGPADGGIVLSVPLIATLCDVLGLFIISIIAFVVWRMYRRMQGDSTSVQGFSNTNTDTSSVNDQIRLQAVTTNEEINT